MDPKLAAALAREDPTVVFYGTSLTKSGGWAEVLIEALKPGRPGLTGINAAADGQHSRWGVENFDPRVLHAKPTILFLEFAVNDALARFEISVEESRRNLETMISRFEATGDGAVVLQVMNPVLDRPAGHTGHRPHLAHYEKMYRSVARERKVSLVDHAPHWERVLQRSEAEFRVAVPDGLHPSLVGYTKYMLPTLYSALGL